MRWLKNIFGSSRAGRLAVLQQIQGRYSVFRVLLEQHNQLLKTISRLEERHRYGELLDFNSLWIEFTRIQEGMKQLINLMIQLGGDRYAPLHQRLHDFSAEIDSLFPANKPTPRDDFVIPFARLGRERSPSVGTKNANLGEMRSVLGLPVPDGFAISAWAYKHFIEANQLQKRIDNLLRNVQIHEYADLEVISDDIREMISLRSVPDDLADAICTAYDQMAATSRSTGFALRSSAVGEDTAFTFAGQYVTFLNVRRDQLLDSYKDILSSKFTPAAIYYLFSHRLAEMDLAMGVACMEMVDSAASGVVYTRDPINPDAPYVVVNSIFGLGKYLVDGIITPDQFHVSRDTHRLVFSQIAHKPVQLIVNPGGGALEAAVEPGSQNLPSLSEEQLGRLTDCALQVERHYNGPQDIEWALSRSGELYILQTRPLRLLTGRAPAGLTVQPGAQELARGGTTICPGLGSGPAAIIKSVAEISAVPPGSVLIAPNPSPRLIAAMHKIKALVTQVGGSASHMATLARELSLPTIGGLTSLGHIRPGQPVTVDATNCVIYAGLLQAPPTAESKPGPAPAPATGHPLINQIMSHMARLKVIHAGDPGFTAENCNSFHDILRFVHQKSLEEIFSSLTKIADKDTIGLRLKTKIPLLINIIYLDQEGFLIGQGKRWVDESALESLPMRAFWGGLLEEGWTQQAVPSDLKGFLSVVGTSIQEGHRPEFSENSYAFLSRDYMLLNLRMGYHFQSIEAIATPQPEKNYVRLQFKLGGAALERRIRRVWLISRLLGLCGFESASEGDYLDSSVAYLTQDDIQHRLRLLGRITILTKQLDITLTSDARAAWYLKTFAEKLGLDYKED